MLTQVCHPHILPYLPHYPPALSPACPFPGSGWSLIPGIHSSNHNEKWRERLEPLCHQLSVVCLPSRDATALVVMTNKMAAAIRQHTYIRRLIYSALCYLLGRWCARLEIKMNIPLSDLCFKLKLGCFVWRDLCVDIKHWSSQSHRDKK